MKSASLPTLTIPMANWRDNILKNFKPKISRLTLVADPDGLLTEEGMLSAIRDRGFDLIPFDDSIAFRFAYESEYRSQWDRVYDRPEFRDEVAAKFPDSIRWTNYGLPPARYVLLAGNLKAFTDDGDEIVAHGGIALEEVLVPFVALTREGA